jgi:acyl dehydratase
MEDGVNRIAGLDALAALVGHPLGRSGWVEVGQDRISAFAEATGDRQWIHVDPERARAESPFGGTVAHGLLTLSLIPVLMDEAFAVEGHGARLNYGLDRVRFPAPVPAGSRLRAAFALRSLEPRPGGARLASVEATVEAEGSPRPACVAELLVLYLP